MYSSVHCSTIYHSQDMEAAQMSIDRGMDKEDVIHTYIHTYVYIYNGISLSHKRNEIMLFPVT